MPKKKIIIGNWKMNPESLTEAKRTLTKIKKVAGTLRKVDTVVCVPAVFLGDLRREATGKRCVLGAQDCYFEPKGSFTGEVSPLQLKSLKVKYVIIGHSERRAMGETDALIAKKVKAAIASGLSVVLCVGEQVRDKDGKYLKQIEKQVEIATADLKKSDFEKLIIAYEPVWAIGEAAKRPAEPRDVFEMKIFVKRILNDKHGKKASEDTRFIYGGSTDDKNAESFLHEGQVDGLLPGRASLDPEKFGAMLRIAEAI